MANSKKRTVKTKSTKSDPDAGMLPETEAEAHAAALARIAAMPPLLVERLTSDGSDIVFEGGLPPDTQSKNGFDSDGTDIVDQCVPLKQLLAAGLAAAAEHDRLGTAQDPPLKPEHERDPAHGKKT